MDLPNNVLLFYYIPRNTILDSKSEEKTTGIIKPKYKLLFKNHKEMDIFIFFVLTTNKSACVNERTFSILCADWEHRDGTHLNAICSYIDVQKIVVMNEEEVLHKAKNPRIGFSYAGKLSQNKYMELYSLVNNYTSSASIKTDFTIRNILKSILAEDGATAFVNKFKI